MRRFAPLLMFALMAGQAQAAEPPRVEGLRTCAQRIEVTGDRTPRTRPSDVRLGPVLFFGLRKAADPDAHEPFDQDADPTWKTAIAVKTGEPVVLAIAGGRTSGASLIYDMRQFRAETVAGGGGDAAVRVKPCPPSTRRFSDGRRVGRWTLFSGGFMFEGPRCVGVQVYRSGRVWSRTVGFGTECP